MSRRNDDGCASALVKFQLGLFVAFSLFCPYLLGLLNCSGAAAGDTVRQTAATDNAKYHSLPGYLVQ